MHSTSNNSYAAIIDEDGRKVAGKKLNNDPHVVLNFLETHREAIKGIVVESTFNWYWLVDNLMASGYKVHLANPTAVQKYKGLKHCGDKEDAFWLAEMLRLDVLPEGYIYPKEERPIWDLFRKRAHLTTGKGRRPTSWLRIMH